MRIGVNLYPSVGGSGVLATRLGNHLADRGHAVHLFTYQQPFSLAPNSKVHVDIVERLYYPLFESIETPYVMSLTSKMLEVIANSGLDLIHAHYAIPHSLAAFATNRLTGVPYVVTMHGSDAHSLGSAPAYRLAVQQTLEKANAVTAVSEFIKNKVNNEIGVEREVVVIPNFIDTSCFSPRSDICLSLETGRIMKKKHDIEEDEKEPILLHVSNFRQGKRVVELMDVVRAVVDHHPTVKLLIAGDGPTRPDTEKRVRSLKIDENVHFLGMRNDISQLLCCSDIFVLFSAVEGMPLTLIEAMSCGVPVLTTPAGGSSELVTSGVEGIVTRQFETEEYMQALLKLIENKSLRRKLGKAGRRKVEKYHSVEAVVPRYERLFEEIVG